VAQALNALLMAESPGKGDPPPDLGAWNASTIAETMASCLDLGVGRDRPGAPARG
jgi:hypothetical protein